MKRTLLAVAAVLIAAAGGMAIAQSAGGATPAATASATVPADGMLAGLNVDSERKRIGIERQQAEDKFNREQVVCYQKFAVNDCIDAARAVRRATLADLRRQEISLNDAERKRKGAEQIRRMEEKEKQLPPPTEMQPRERGKPAADPAGKERTARDPNEPRQPLSPRANPRTPRQPEVKDPVAAEALAAQERAQYERKLNEAAAHKAQTEKRNAERTKPRAQPLPPAP